MLCHDRRSERRTQSAIRDLPYAIHFGPSGTRTLYFLHHVVETAKTNLDMLSYSAADAPASNEKRIRAFSVPLWPYASRLPVLRFLGIRSSPGASVFRPLVVFSYVSSPV